jgi:PhoPQ-activated pathogenicity-related protein
VKYLRYVPNAEHSLRGSDAWMTLLACYSAILKQTKLPQFSWTIQDGSIRVQAQDKPSAVKLWQATNEKTRDFRIGTIKDAWKSTDLTEAGSGGYLAQVAKPTNGWTAFFVELTFPSSAPAPFKFTTDVKVVPDINPHKYTQPTAPR